MNYLFAALEVFVFIIDFLGIWTVSYTHLSTPTANWQHVVKLKKFSNNAGTSRYLFVFEIRSCTLIVSAVYIVVVYWNRNEYLGSSSCLYSLHRLLCIPKNAILYAYNTKAVDRSNVASSSRSIDSSRRVQQYANDIDSSCSTLQTGIHRNAIWSRFAILRFFPGSEIDSTIHFVNKSFDWVEKVFWE